MARSETQADRIIRTFYFSEGFVSVPREDVDIGEGFMPCFGTEDGCYCFHSLDYTNKNRLLYRGPSLEPDK